MATSPINPISSDRSAQDILNASLSLAVSQLVKKFLDQPSQNRNRPGAKINLRSLSKFNGSGDRSTPE